MQGLLEVKSKSPLFPGGGVSKVTNDKCITHLSCSLYALSNKSNKQAKMAEKQQRQLFETLNGS